MTGGCFDPLPLSPDGAESPGAPGQPNGAGWALDTPAKGIVAISLMLAVYAIAVTPLSPILVAVDLDGVGVAAVAQALSDPSGTVSDTNGGPISGATAVLEQGPTAEGPFTAAVASSPGTEPHVNPQKTSADGEFRWDVVSDYYKVAASAHGCHAPGDPAQTTVSTPVSTRPAAALRPGPGPPVQPRACAVPPDSNVAVQSSRGKQGWLPDRGSRYRLHALGYGSFRLGPISGCDLRLAQPSRCDGPSAGEGTVRCLSRPWRRTARPSSGDQLSYIAYPAISGISPQSGPSARGTRVTVHSLGLTGAQLVRVRYSPATNLKVEPNGDLVITVPPGQKRTVDVTVTTPLGTSTPAPHDRFTYVKTAPPRH